MFCPPANTPDDMNTLAAKGEKFAYHFYTTTQMNLGTFNVTSKDVYKKLFKFADYQFYGHPAIIYPKNSMLCKLTFSYFTGTRQLKEPAVDKYTSSSEYTVRIKSTVKNMRQMYPMVYFKCLYNCGWGHGQASTGLVFSDYYDIVAIKYLTFHNYVDSPSNPDLKDRAKWVTPLTSAHWYINGVKKGIHKPLIDYSDPLNTYLIFKEEEFLPEEKTVVNLQIYSKFRHRPQHKLKIKPVLKSSIQALLFDTPLEYLGPFPLRRPSLLVPQGTGSKITSGVSYKRPWIADFKTGFILFTQ